MNDLTTLKGIRDTLKDLSNALDRQLGTGRSEDEPAWHKPTGLEITGVTKLREELIRHAWMKPIRKFTQFDVFFDVVDDALMTGDDDGDDIFRTERYELRTSPSMRVYVPYQAKAEDVLRGLKKVITWIEREPETVTKEWGEDGSEAGIAEDGGISF